MAVPSSSNMGIIVHLFVYSIKPNALLRAHFRPKRAAAKPGSRAAAGRRQRTLDAGAPKPSETPTIQQAPAQGRGLNAIRVKALSG
jgi:hypothetical protein